MDNEHDRQSRINEILLKTVLCAVAALCLIVFIMACRQLVTGVPAQPALPNAISIITDPPGTIVTIPFGSKVLHFGRDKYNAEFVALQMPDGSVTVSYLPYVSGYSRYPLLFRPAKAESEIASGT